MLDVLIAEDDNNIRNLMSIKLKQAGYNIIPAIDGEDAYNKVFENHIDIMIVDVMMPKMDGFELLKALRANGKNIPAIVCTARGSISDKAQGFEIGIDDYMVKPIDFDELVMRIKAVLKRAKLASDNVLKIGNVVLEYNTLTISEGDTKVALTKKEFKILFKLLSSPDKSFSKNQLFEEFWDFDSDTEEDVVKVFINKIRNKIAVFPTIGIDTIRGIGYKGVRNE